MYVKAQGLINGAAWLEAEYGPRELADVLGRCSAVVRARYESGIAIEWHPMAELVEFLEVAEQVVGDGRGRVAEQMGAYSARKSTEGFVSRALLYIASPAFLMRRITQTWSRYNSAGEMRLLHMSERRASIEIADIPQPHRLFCAVLTGWTRVICQAVGGLNPHVVHETCRAEGDARCIWRVGWRDIATDATDE